MNLNDIVSPEHPLMTALTVFMICALTIGLCTLFFGLQALWGLFVAAGLGLAIGLLCYRIKLDNIIGNHSAQR